MNLEARAPRVGLNLNLTTKNLIIVLMCLVFMAMFAYDGFYAYPDRNSAIVNAIVRPAVAADGSIPLSNPDLLAHWKTWNEASREDRKAMDDLVEKAKQALSSGNAPPISPDPQLTNKEIAKRMEGWKSSTDINLQRWIAAALILIFIGALWRFIAGVKLRVSASDATVSPRQGVVIPWERITKVDNTDWRTYGIVKITYTDASGNPAQAEFDDYKTQREQLLPILDALGEKAVNAEFIPKQEPAPEAGAAAP